MMSARQQVHACRRPLPKGVRLRCSSLRVSSTKSLPRWVGSGPIGTIGLENAAQLYAMRASAREATKNFNPEQNRSRLGGTGGTGGTRRGNHRTRWDRAGYWVVLTSLPACGQYHRVLPTGTTLPGPFPFEYHLYPLYHPVKYAHVSVAEKRRSWSAAIMGGSALLPRSGAQPPAPLLHPSGFSGLFPPLRLGGCRCGFRSVDASCRLSALLAKAKVLGKCGALGRVVCCR